MHFKYLKHEIDSFTQENLNPNLKEKNYVFIIHKEFDLNNTNKTKLNWEIDFTGQNLNNKNNWQFIVIENLKDSYYKYILHII